MQYINSNDILYDKQFRFRKGHCTSHAIIILAEKVSKALGTGKIVVGVYLEVIYTGALIFKFYLRMIFPGHLNFFFLYFLLMIPVFF